MSTIAEIIKAVERLRPQQFLKLRHDAAELLRIEDAVQHRVNGWRELAIYTLIVGRALRHEYESVVIWKAPHHEMSNQIPHSPMLLYLL